MECLKDIGVNPVLLEKMSKEEIDKALEFTNVKDMENYLLALAIAYGI